MWLKLTNYDGVPCRVNMDNIAHYYPQDSDGGKTFLEYAVSGDTMQGVHVQETMEQIDTQITHEYSLRECIKSKSGW